MRILLLTRGAPGCGKSTWIKNHELETYTLSPDELRIKCNSLELQPSGNFKVSQNRNNEDVVWSVLFKILEHRMSRGEFTVIDATCSKTKDIQQYKQLAEQYRYRIVIIDFTHITLQVCLKQNKMRPEVKWVPDKAIENIYARFATQQIPTGVTIISPDEFNTILEKPFNVSNYQKVVFIGDIHGCYDTLMQYPDFKNGLKFVDQNGFMTKCKTGYYNLWKQLRGVADQTLRCGYITRTGGLTTAFSNTFYGFVKSLYNQDFNKETKTYPYKTDIISLREKFLREN